MLSQPVLIPGGRPAHQLGGEAMPTKIFRRRRGSRRELGPYRRHELLTGKADYPSFGYTGYGDGEDTDMTHFISEEMRQDWLANRAELLAFWRSGEFTTVFPDSKPWLFIRGNSKTLPWAAMVFDKDDEPEPRRARKRDPDLALFV
jgi:hypothetical protein